MIRWIVGVSLKFRFLVIFLAVIMTFFGIAQARNMPVDVFPEFAPPQAEIQTPSLGLSSEEVEALVTVPLEQALQGIPGLAVMRSKSVAQLSSIKLIFKRDTDLMEARQLIQERLAIVTPTLPTWAAPPFLLPPLSSTSRLMKIGLSSSEYSVMDMSMTTYWKIRERLLEIPGVANIAMWGERIEIPQVQVEPELLATHGTTLDEVLQVTSDTLDSGMVQYSGGATRGTGGWLETANQRIPIRHVMPILSADSLAQVPINEKKKSDGTPLRLADVGDVVVDTWPMIGDAVINDGEGLLLIVEKFPWGNNLALTRAVEAAIEEMKPGLQGIDIDTTIFRPATFVEISIQNLGRAMIIGSILVVLVLFLFLWEWRIALISATIIPLSLVATILVLPYFGAQVSTINVMVLAGLVIAIGAVVDDAIVDVENIVRRLRQQRKEGADISTARIILDASVEVRNAIIYASLIEAVALIPVFFLEGLSGAFFQPLATAYVIAVLVSGLIALTVTPALSLVLLTKVPLDKRESPILPWLHRTYDKLLIVHRPMLAYATFVILVLAGIGVWPFLGEELLPSFKERDFLMHWLTKPGSSHPEMVRISQAACQELRTIPGVRNCGSHIGQALLMDEVYGIYFGENWISVDPSVDYDQTLASVQSLVDGYPGLYRDVQTYLKERIREVLTGSSDAVVVRIYGEDLDVLRAKATEIEEEMLTIDGLIDVHQELLLDIPQIQIKVDLAKAQQYGLKPGDVRRAASYLLAGEEAGDIHTSNRTYDVNVWSTPPNRHSLNSIQNLLIDTPSGRQVRLTEVADVRIVPVANAVQRENLSRRLHVEANIERGGRDLGAVVADVKAVLERTEFPLGYHPELLGEFAERQAAQRNLLSVAGISAIGILFLLWISFQSWRLAFLSFLSLPTALVGGVLAAFFFSNGVISLGSLVGFLTILGIAARNGIMMINHFQHLEEFEGETFGPKLVRRGAQERVAPILMTALTTGLALIPLAVAGNLPGHEIEHPMAIVILGGLITSTWLNLFIIPALYLRFGEPMKPQPEAGTLSSQPAPAAG